MFERKVTHLRLAALGISQTKQTGSGKMKNIRFDGFFNFSKIQSPVRFQIQRLGLDTAKYRSATGFVFKGVSRLTHNIFIPVIL